MFDPYANCQEKGESKMKMPCIAWCADVNGKTRSHSRTNRLYIFNLKAKVKLTIDHNNNAFGQSISLLNHVYDFISSTTCVVRASNCHFRDAIKFFHKNTETISIFHLVILTPMTHANSTLSTQIGLYFYLCYSQLYRQQIHWIHRIHRTHKIIRLIPFSSLHSDMASLLPPLLLMCWEP